ncbi:hypothetical protein [Nitrosovibrio sp. Nv6]|uniref:hypothetical protein n=1 Tax=Nitrosovibrio sp. Nv6 TaxID=1855340 RepID=UPI0008B5A7EC|nr:hypothetical protein [Nitrosovibrio sp. Nv6]SEP27626.1 hypothetical protein SAMN05216316_2258 [Nitrosovibrio sp. Nv6]
MKPEPECQEYEGHSIELRERKGKLELLIDNVPIRYGQMHNGMYFLHEYAFDHTHDLMELARRFVDYRRKVDMIRREQSLKGGK